jgi:HEAT repeat protein/cyclophilin family peptidyl-prolyl cis-trans isomerase
MDVGPGSTTPAHEALTMGNTRGSAFAAAVVALLAGACATAPPPLPPRVTYEEKLSWILRLEDERVLREPAAPPVTPAPPSARPAVVPPSPPPSPDLVRLLADPEGRVRRRAALAIGRVGLKDGVPPLVERLADPEPEVRQMVAFALGLLGDRSAVEPLRARLSDPDVLVRGRAAEALGLIGGPAAAAAIGEMTAACMKSGSLSEVAADEVRYPLAPAIEAFRLGVYALARLKAYEPLAACVLQPDGRPLVRWWPVAYALQRTRDPRAVPALLSLARGDGTDTRAFAAAGLGALKERSAVEVLAPMAQAWSSDPRAAVVAVRALGQIGDARAVPVLLKLLQTRDLDPGVRLEVVGALGGCRAASATSVLLDLLSHPWPALRSEALKSLRAIDPQNFLLVLSGLGPDRHWSVRATVATLLGTFTPEVATPGLTDMLQDADARVIPAVLAALVSVRAPKVEAVLLDRLTADDPVVRMSAAAGLGELKSPGGPQALAEAYRFGQRDDTYVARAAALGALAKYGAAAALPLLKEAFADKDWAVRIRAATLARELDPSIDAASLIRPAPTGRPRDAYASSSLVSPSVSPQLYIETDKGTITVELAVLDAPLTSDTLLALVGKGFFTNLAIHRVVPNFVVQDGDPRGDGEGGPGFTIRDEPNDVPYLRGTVGMALDWADTGGSQFFITISPQPHLDGRYTVVGRVVDGMEVVDRLQQWDTIKRVRAWDGVRWR